MGKTLTALFIVVACCLIVHTIRMKILNSGAPVSRRRNRSGFLTNNLLFLVFVTSLTGWLNPVKFKTDLEQIERDDYEALQ